MAYIDIKITQDNTQQIIAEKNAAVLRALEIIGQVVENSAAGYAPVDTGNLRNSITHEVDDGEHCVYIGSNVEYAPYQMVGVVFYVLPLKITWRKYKVYSKKS